MTEIPLSKQNYGAWFICEARNDIRGERLSAVAKFEVPTHWRDPVSKEFHIGTGWSFEDSSSALSAEDIRNVRERTYEIAMGSEVVTLVNPKNGKTFLHHPYFYHWGTWGPMEISTQRLSWVEDNKYLDKDRPSFGFTSFFLRF